VSTFPIEKDVFPASSSSKGFPVPFDLPPQRYSNKGETECCVINSPKVNQIKFVVVLTFNGIES